MKTLKIGSLILKNSFCLAPMAGITDLAFRMTVRPFGCALCLTEMISADGLVRGIDRSFAFLKSSPSDSPLGAQIFGSEPAILADAARIVSDRGADLVDINMGCPVKNVVKRGAGASLMREPVKIGSILHAVRKATSLPLTIKIRGGWDFGDINALEVSRIAEDAGVDAIFLHSRTASQGFRGRADWRLIAEVKAGTRIPIVGNGDVLRAADALRMIETTGCDGVMLGRAVRGNPWIFREITDSLAERCDGIPDLEERRRVIQEHLHLSVEIFGEPMGVKTFLRHLFWYTKGLPGISHIRRRAGSAWKEDDLRLIIDDFFSTLGTESLSGKKHLDFCKELK
jgi:nifR3 family TIM-barrel protein